MSIGATLTLAVDDYQGKPLNWGIVNIDGYGFSCDAGAAEVGDGGIGILNITNGGRLRTNSWSYLGWSSMGTGAGGTVNVDGAGSKWNCTTYGISINMAAPGMLNITNGGVVTAPQLVIYGGGTKLAIDSQSLLEITIGGNGSVSGGSGGMTNNGIVRIAAGPAAQARQYTPISAGTLSGTGIWQALGGTWNLSSRQFTVSSLQTGASGAPVGIDLASIQRVLVSSSPTGGSLVREFRGGGNFDAAQLHGHDAQRRAADFARQPFGSRSVASGRLDLHDRQRLHAGRPRLSLRSASVRATLRKVWKSGITTAPCGHHSPRTT